MGYKGLYPLRALHSDIHSAEICPTKREGAEDKLRQICICKRDLLHRRTESVCSKYSTY